MRLNYRAAHTDASSTVALASSKMAAVLPTDAVEQPTATQPQQRSPVWKTATAACLVLLGFAFAISVGIRAAVQHGECESIMTSTVWARSSPKVFFSQGLFAQTSCGFELVEVLELDNSQLQRLPDSIGSY